MRLLLIALACTVPIFVQNLLDQINFNPKCNQEQEWLKFKSTVDLQNYQFY